jgi:micrococcal nuclease
MVLFWVVAITFVGALGFWYWRLRPHPTLPDGVQPVVVQSIQDGDTMEVTALGPGRVLSTAEKVRVKLLGVDAPELRDGSGSGRPQCWAENAKAHLDRLAPDGSYLWVIDDREKVDDKGRRLLYAWTPDGVFLNARLAELGSARLLTSRAKLRYHMEISKKVDEARQARRGLWGACTN